MNNSAPIINNEREYKIIGTIVQFEENKIKPIEPIKPPTKPPGRNNGISDEEYNLNYHTDKPFIRCHYNKCPNKGLQNIGATCYMNATLQCFCHIEKFLNFFKYSKLVTNIVKEKDNLTASFKLLIEKLWPNYVISNLYKII